APTGLALQERLPSPVGPAAVDLPFDSQERPLVTEVDVLPTQRVRLVDSQPGVAAEDDQVADVEPLLRVAHLHLLAERDKLRIPAGFVLVSRTTILLNPCGGGAGRLGQGQAGCRVDRDVPLRDRKGGGLAQERQ